ncbi:hypothetical protein J4402_03530 [Candidatus Pacearchaeota archaeon]|nr:hypothetical protein [Candidatus Pacearchaeota archaeon]
MKIKDAKNIKTLFCLFEQECDKMIKVTAPVRIDISAGWSDADPFRGQFGGAVLNAAITLRVSGILDNNKLTTSLEKVPAASGLGTSGALRTAYLVIANPSLIENKMELVKRVNTFENAIVGQRAGFQDQCAAIFGGVNYWDFYKDGSIRRISIPESKATHLFDRLVLVYTGDRHQSSDVHSDVFVGKTYMKHIFAIQRMKEIAREMKTHITNEKMMAVLINETWELQKSLHLGMETFAMKKIQKFAEGDYLACRATGAGGGGCMIFYTDKKQKLISKLKKADGQLHKMRVIPFKFDYGGIRFEK